MSLGLGIPLFLIAMLLQATVLSQLRVFGGQPDLILVIVLAWSTLDQDQEGLVWAFVGGLFMNLISGVPFGVSSLALLPVAFVVSRTEAALYRASLILPALLMAAGALAYHILYLLLLNFLVGQPIEWRSSLTFVTLPSILFDVILIVPALRILGSWHDRLHPRSVRL